VESKMVAMQDVTNPVLNTEVQTSKKWNHLSETSQSEAEVRPTAAQIKCQAEQYTIKWILINQGSRVHGLFK
jgi:hypothetical protein